ncbi:plasmid replication protein RepC [Tropicimonas sp. IMCC34043]|uniref:plasmid replication protein RepC n=1 Tax=Tropicimonas sp. IMCC34043 TaxID=2248760 RepID=UPI0018E55887|nr:plasmid replication protein RepC [Tropicimonas sp. IMCC34043]
MATAPHKWRDLIAPLKRCAGRLSLNGTDLHFLEVLVSFVDGDYLTLDRDGRLVVFAGNAAIARRMGLSGDSTVNRCIRRAEACGLVQRVMSPNRKRFRRVGGDGTVLRSYGIDIGPLVAGRGRLQQIAAEVAADAARIEALRLDCADELARLRRLMQRLDPRTLRLEDLAAAVTDFARRLRRTPTIDRLTDMLVQIRSVLARWTTSEAQPVATAGVSDAVAQSERHIDQTPNTPVDEAAAKEKNTTVTEQDITRAFPTLTAILAQSRGPREISDALDNTARLLPNSLESWKHAVASMGTANAALLLGYVLERGAEIANPGGYLRRLVDRWGRGELELGQLIRSRLAPRPYHACGLSR